MGKEVRENLFHEVRRRVETLVQWNWELLQAGAKLLSCVLRMFEEWRGGIAAGDEYVLGRVLGGDVIRSSMDHGFYFEKDLYFFFFF